MTDDELDIEIALLEQQILECHHDIEEAEEDNDPKGVKGPGLVLRIRDLENRLQVLQQLKLEKAQQPAASKAFDARDYWANLASKAPQTPEKTEGLRPGYKPRL